MRTIRRLTLRQSADTVSIVSVAVLVGILGSRYGRPLFQSWHQANTGVAVGDTFPTASGLVYGPDRTLLLLMDVGCSWSDASSQFYSALVRDLPGDIVPVFGLPQEAPMARQYVASLGLPTSVRIVRADPKEFHTVAPALLLFDKTGKVLVSWSGKLEIAEEASVRRVLGVQEQSHSDGERGAGSGDAVLLDIRPRALLNREPSVPDAKSIPFDELETRAVHEIPREYSITLACVSCVGRGCDVGQQAQLRNICGLAKQALTALGYHDVMVSDR